jgi:branched-chain amino acid transport system permease protein
MSTTVRWVGAGALVALAAVLPLIENREIPYVFDGELASPGVLNLLALMLVFGALAMTYDLLFGYTGLLSFGHALYFAIGVYGTAIATSRLDLGLGGAVLLVAAIGVVAPIVIGAICLRVGDIAFAMVTLAFAQAGAIFVARDPLDITGGELGKALAFEQLPDALVGVVNTRNLYWLALALVVIVYVVARVAVSSPAGRVWQAIRENEQRVEVLGLRPTTYKLAVFVLSSFLATASGVVYVLVVGGAHPGVTLATFTLTLLVMVVLGGTGRLWGALVGGMLYTYLDHRLGELSTQPEVQDLPAVIRVPMSEPMFILGTLFVVIVLFLPGGIAGALTGRRVPLAGRLLGRRPAASAGPEPPPAAGSGGTITTTTAAGGKVER